MPPAPRFCDVTGEALNDAAFELTRAATSSSYVDARAPSDDSPLRRIPRVVVDSGRWKYVLAQVRVEGRDDEAILVVRALRGTTWHADNFARLREEMRASARATTTTGKGERVRRLRRRWGTNRARRRGEDDVGVRIQ